MQDSQRYAQQMPLPSLSAAGEIDVLAGGPPCQGFSKNVPRSLRSAEDANNLLVRTFLSYCEYIKPKVILMENVAEMKNGFSGQFSDEITRRLADAGYPDVAKLVLNAAEFGVPKRRRRAFFIAARGVSGLEAPAPLQQRGNGAYGRLIVLSENGSLT